MTCKKYKINKDMTSLLFTDETINKENEQGPPWQSQDQRWRVRSDLWSQRESFPVDCPTLGGWRGLQWSPGCRQHPARSGAFFLEKRPHLCLPSVLRKTCQHIPQDKAHCVKGGQGDKQHNIMGHVMTSLQAAGIRLSFSGPLFGIDVSELITDDARHMSLKLTQH